MSLGWIGPYQVLRQLGAGANGEVYLARDTLQRVDVALKVLGAGLDEVEVARFEREIESLRRLGSHVNVVGIAGAGRLPTGRPYVAMEYVEGVDLADLIKRGLAPDKLVDYSLQICSALGFAHELGEGCEPGHELALRVELFR